MTKEVKKKMHVKKRNGRLILLIPLLILSLLNFSHVTGIESEYEVNPDYYAINVDPEESRTYVFDRIRFQEDHGFEMRKMMMNITIDGQKYEIPIAEGSKVTVEFLSENDTYIKTKHFWQLTNGSKYESDTELTNKSTLSVRKDNGYTRMIFTTNDSLIRDVYVREDPDWWDIFFEGDRVRIRNDSWEGPNNFEEEYEYNLTTGFLTQMRLRYESEGHRSEIEFRETRAWDPDWFEVGVSPGDTNTYVLSKMKWYDHYDQTYRHETHMPVVVDGTPQYIQLHEGDEINTEIVSTTGDFIELELTYKQHKDRTVTIDEHPYLIDKSTFWAPRDLGPPLLMTINRTTWEHAPPGEVDIGDDVIKFFNEHESPDGYWYDQMEGAWNLTTGWMQRFYNIHIEDFKGENEIIQREMEIIDTDFYDPGEEPEEPAEFVGVDEGDSITYEFKDILMSTNDVSSLTSGSDDTFYMIFQVDGKEKEVAVQPGDTMTIEIKEVSGSRVTMVTTIDSSLDGEVVTDPIKVDLKTEDLGPRFLLPADKDMIEDHFDDYADMEIDYDGKNVTIWSSSSEEDMDYYNTMIYDLDTGWLIEYNRTVTEDGEIVESILVIATDLSSSEETSESTKTFGNGVELTPLPVFPVLCALILIGSIIQKKRRGK